MTLNKAISELIEELNKSNLTEEERRALDKYRGWLFTIKTTVTNNTEMLPFYERCMTCKRGGNYSPFWHPYPGDKPCKDKVYLVTVEDSYGLSVGTAKWHQGGFCTSNIHDVVAWAELPKAYNKAQKTLKRT